MREEIIKMAREAGFIVGEPWREMLIERFFHMAQAAERANWPAEMEAMERQVNILTDELAKAVAAEREACAKVCYELMCKDNPYDRWEGMKFCMDAIRARSGEKK